MPNICRPPRCPQHWITRTRGSCPRATSTLMISIQHVRDLLTFDFVRTTSLSNSQVHFHLCMPLYRLFTHSMIQDGSSEQGWETVSSN